MAYLADLFEGPNTLNLKLQGRSYTIINNYDSFNDFMAKLHLRNERVPVRDFTSFPQLDDAVKDNDLENDLKESTESHLISLHDEL
jgi:hypothetical protein